MEVAAHIDALRGEGRLMADAAENAGLAAPVPTCPEWVVRDLVRHLGGVHRWATGYVAGPRTEQWDVDLDDVVGTWPGDADLVGWFRQGYESLAGALEAAPPDLECWTFLRAPSPLAMWARRQAHETAIHRVDAELAAGVDLTPCSAPFAADGVSELLECFVPRRSTKLRREEPASLAVGCTDEEEAWLLRIGPDGVTTEPGPARRPAPTAPSRGEALDLYLALWNRSGPEALVIEGDGDVLRLFLDTLRVRWS